MHCSKRSAAWACHRTLALCPSLIRLLLRTHTHQISELIYASTVVHDGIVDIGNEAADGSDADRIKGLRFGNKMAILGGDFLLASSCTGLSKLKSAPVVSLMSEAIAESVEGSYASYNSRELISLAAWSQVAYLRTASLLAHSCEASQSQMIYQNRATCGFEMRFAPSTFGAGSQRPQPKHVSNPDSVIKGV